jgi:uncharacterized protein YkwD
VHYPAVACGGRRQASERHSLRESGGTPTLSAHTSSARGTAAEAGPPVDAEFGKAVFLELNKARKARNETPYVAAPRFREAAQAHVRDLARHGLFSHDSSNGESCDNRIRHLFPSRGWPSWSIGECLFWISTEATTAHDVQAWLDSPEHRAIVLSPKFQRVGIGVVHLRSGSGTFAGAQRRSSTPTSAHGCDSYAVIEP